MENKDSITTPPNVEVKTKVAETREEQLLLEEKAEQQSNLNDSYVYKRSVTIAPLGKLKESLFRKVNAKALPAARSVIGSAIKSKKTLLGGSNEMKTYLPSVIGIGATHHDFEARANDWFENITYDVPPAGLKLDISFKFDKKSDYYKFAREEAKIESVYEKANKTNPSALVKAIKTKVEALNDLESGLHKVGIPVNVIHYILYRHCLLYGDVAKDKGVIDFSPNVRFYIVDEQKEEREARKAQISFNIAMSNYSDLISNPTKFNSFYRVYCGMQGRGIVESMLLSDIIKQQEVSKFATEQPNAFNKLCQNKNLDTMALIETLIDMGEFYRLAGSQNITDSNNNLIGANMKEAIMYLENPANKDIRKGLELKIRL